MAPRRLWIRLRCTPTVRFLFVLISQKGSRGVLLQTQGLIPVSHTHTYTHTHTHLHTHTHTLTLTHTHTYTLTYTHAMPIASCAVCLLPGTGAHHPTHSSLFWTSVQQRFALALQVQSYCLSLPLPSAFTNTIFPNLPGSLSSLHPAFTHTHPDTHRHTHTHSHTSLPPSSASFSLLPPFTTRVAQLQARKSRATSCRASWRDPRC